MVFDVDENFSRLHICWAHHVVVLVVIQSSESVQALYSIRINRRSLIVDCLLIKLSIIKIISTSTAYRYSDSKITD